jgi:hypothetical protein
MIWSYRYVRRPAVNLQTGIDSGGMVYPHLSQPTLTRSTSRRQSTAIDRDLQIDILSIDLSRLSVWLIPDLWKGEDLSSLCPTHVLNVCVKLAGYCVLLRFCSSLRTKWLEHCPDFPNTQTKLRMLSNKYYPGDHVQCYITFVLKQLVKCPSNFS